MQIKYDTTPSYEAESNARSLCRHWSTVTALLSPFVKTTSPLFQSKPVSLFVFVFVHFSNPNLSLPPCICICPLFQSKPAPLSLYLYLSTSPVQTCLSLSLYLYLPPSVCLLFKASPAGQSFLDALASLDFQLSLSQ